jgi:apolipoprotein D and lipocalin family protein
MRQLLILAAACLGLSACVINPVYRLEEQSPLTAQPIDRAAYLGLWHEQARLPNAFERGCARATAEYGERNDGQISVRNTCFEADGEQRVANGRARVVGEGQLKVSFFGPFWADYWVLARAEDYSWSIVGEPRGRYLWLLTRAETLSDAERASFEQRIRALGFDPADMVWAG